MSLEQRAKIIETAKSNPYGIREIIRLMKTKNSNIISLLQKMNDEQLIEIKTTNIPKRGRPQKRIIVTPLGCEFFKTYQVLKTKPLRARKEDLKHAAKDALYAKRLVESGHSPFQVFMELNTIASNIERSSKNS